MNTSNNTKASLVSVPCDTSAEALSIDIPLGTGCYGINSEYFHGRLVAKFFFAFVLVLCYVVLLVWAFIVQRRASRRCHDEDLSSFCCYRACSPWSHRVEEEVEEGMGDVVEENEADLLCSKSMGK